MNLPSELFNSYIQPKSIYYFSTDKLNTPESHYFICITKNSVEMIILVCCTSQFKKRANFIESRNLPQTTLVWIEPDSKNGLKMDSYVDCNGIFDFSTNELKSKFDNETLKYIGEISDDVYQQILIGLHDSTLITEAQKEYFPNKDSI